MNPHLPADDATCRFALINERTGEALASRVELALTRHARRTGLLGQTGLDPAAALLLVPCFMIHTAFMRFAIDAVFVDRGGRVVRVVHALKPWRAAVTTGAYATIELAAGVVARRGVAVGDRLELVDVTSGSEGPHRC
ncbi:MAG: DUF192 domain-containing protein [Acidobacteria bacterium]|nr:DUF192 domain-containing protein [Acidobacteriota bacterium]